MKHTKLKSLFLLIILASSIFPYIPAQAEAVWLAGGWSHRIQLTIDSDSLAVPLVNFPILVHISTASGISNDDVSFIFDEIIDEPLAVAFTSSDGETQLYAEVEYWNNILEEGAYWVKIPNVSNTTDTDFYMYFEATADDNEDYIGYTNSVVSTNVWDEYFIFVHHMADGEDNAHIYDSTGNNYDGTKVGANDPVQQLGMVAGYSQDFDGGDSSITLGLVPYDETTNSITLEAWVVIGSLSNSDCIIGGTGGFTGATLGFSDTNVLYGGLRVGTGGYVDYYYVHNMAIDDTTMYYFSGVYDDAVDYTGRAYTNATEIGNTAGNIEPTFGNGAKARVIGANAALAGNPQIEIDEVRASSIARSPSWITATHRSGLDTFIEYGEIEQEVAYTYVTSLTTATATVSTTNCATSTGVTESQSTATAQTTITTTATGSSITTISTSLISVNVYKTIFVTKTISKDIITSTVSYTTTSITSKVSTTTQTASSTTTCDTTTGTAASTSTATVTGTETITAGTSTVVQTTTGNFIATITKDETISHIVSKIITNAQTASTISWTTAITCVTATGSLSTTITSTEYSTVSTSTATDTYSSTVLSTDYSTQCATTTGDATQTITAQSTSDFVVYQTHSILYTTSYVENFSVDGVITTLITLLEVAVANNWGLLFPFTIMIVVAYVLMGRKN